MFDSIPLIHFPTLTKFSILTVSNVFLYVAEIKSCQLLVDYIRRTLDTSVCLLSSKSTNKCAQ